MRRSRHRIKTNSASHVEGFTLIEMMITLAIIGICAAGAAIMVPNFLSQSRADGAVAQALNTLRVARDRAIGERRNIELHFITPNHIQIVRQEYLEADQKFLLFTGLGDTPDQFGVSSNPVAFATTPVMFTSEGTLVDTVGDVTNGTLFLGKTGDSSSARAITIFGTTALLRTWRWSKTQWVE